MGWEVDEIETTVRGLRARGVVFEEYDFPGLTTVDGIADIEGNYPTKASGNAARGSVTAKATCWASASRFGAETPA